uniref:Uncharacterized protein n=1 Tax=Anguilla anguilla TaxID=7936 RepID=A0A0E9R5I7_ANGAN
MYGPVFFTFPSFLPPKIHEVGEMGLSCNEAVVKIYSLTGNVMFYHQKEK